VGPVKNENVRPFVQKVRKQSVVIGTEIESIFLSLQPLSRLGTLTFFPLNVILPKLHLKLLAWILLFTFILFNAILMPMCPFKNTSFQDLELICKINEIIQFVFGSLYLQMNLNPE
jgi:hypothetical protein